MSAIYAFNVLKNVDENVTRYIERYADYQVETSKRMKNDARGRRAFR